MEGYKYVEELDKKFNLFVANEIVDELIEIIDAIIVAVKLFEIPYQSSLSKYSSHTIYINRIKFLFELNDNMWWALDLFLDEEQRLVETRMYSSYFNDSHSYIEKDLLTPLKKLLKEISVS